MSDIQTLVENQRNFFNSQATKPVAERKEKLKKLKASIKNREQEICAALKADLNKSAGEAYLCEIGMVLNELSHFIKHIDKWTKPKKCPTEPVFMPARPVVYLEPYGVVLIMSPWNYPFLLTMSPLAGAIAAGNTCVVKPSKYSPETSKVMKAIVKDVFEEDYVTVVEGGREANTELLEQHFNYIFFTGGVTVGKLVMEKAAKHLTPVSLELGGKSPCIIDETADIKMAAKRLVWGKFLNGGQTCIAPDYVLVQSSVKDRLLEEAVKWIKVFYGDGTPEHLPKIITQKHFERVSALVNNSNPANGKIVVGGTTNPATRQIAPTILDGSLPDSPVMSEEIFGPVLPVMTYEKLDDVIKFVSGRPHPLALYLFSNSKATQKRIVSTLEFGGGCINDTIEHISISTAPFGGVGNSGIGNYHGQYSIRTFSHEKSVLHNTTCFDMEVRYHPITKKKMGIVKSIMK